MRYTIANKVLTCPHCGGFEFTKTESIVTLRTHAFLNPFDPEIALSFACDACGRLEWFKKSDNLPDFGADTREAVDCLCCDGSIPAGSTACPNCGWTYRAAP